MNRYPVAVAPRALRRRYVGATGLRSVVQRTPWVVAAAVALVVAVAPAVPTGLAAQQAPPPPRAPQQAVPLEISPRGAFLRALAVPGWGHAAIGAYTRGGFYFAAQSATVYTLLRTRARIGEAQDRVRLRESLLRTRAEGEGSTPDEIETLFAEDPALQELRGLLEARKDQQEDLVALGIALLFLSGADAYVSAHLARFPEPLEVSGGPTPDGRVELALRLKLPN